MCDNAACEKNCGNLNETCIIKNIKCDNKCFCNKDFVRESPNGPCIPISKCPPNKCKINEVFECRNPTCDDEGCCIEKGRSCKDVPCEIKCYCADGFVRIDGACVSRDNCFKDQCPANEVFECRDEKCGEQRCFESCIATEKNLCINKCFCADGFKRMNGICIPENKCPKEIFTCNPDEVFECRELNCDDCPFPPPCEFKCYCAPGLVQIDGKCIPERDICLKPNTEYSTCGYTCEGQSCTKPKEYRNCVLECGAGCFCKKGFILDDKGNCVLIETCPKSKL